MIGKRWWSFAVCSASPLPGHADPKQAHRPKGQCRANDDEYPRRARICPILHVKIVSWVNRYGGTLLVESA